jgi:SpoVK/Ycf46/Vps4 family AAA+-type ATPase
MDSRFAWDDLVLPKSETATLRAIAARLRTTIDQPGGPGIGALFAGPSGTAKTMAAEVLAGDLNLELYRIDLSALVSKYIGETEKNLRAVFEAAEQGGAILLFDEADALFGKRSEVKDSHDRYADIEVGFLLRQMEAFRGLTILASDEATPLDPALLRCLTFVVRFPFP